MPVIVVGADTPSGMELVGAFNRPDREVRAFVTDEATAVTLRGIGVKVALGDVSDEGHVEAACTWCFTAVLVAAAASDDRERAFAGDNEAVLAGWARAVAGARVNRVIWVASGQVPNPAVPEVGIVDPTAPDLTARVVALDDAQSI